MPRIPLLGGAYQARSVIAEAQRSVNLFAEKNPTDAPTQVTHYPTPGLRKLVGVAPPELEWARRAIRPRLDLFPRGPWMVP